MDASHCLVSGICAPASRILADGTSDTEPLYIHSLGQALTSAPSAFARLWGHSQSSQRRLSWKRHMTAVQQFGNIHAASATSGDRPAAMRLPKLPRAMPFPEEW